MKNTLNNTPGSRRGRDTKNFSELNFKKINLGNQKNAWTFFKVNLKEENLMIGSRDYPDNFLIRTESGNIYKILKTNSKEIEKLTNKDYDMANKIANWPVEWCIINPETKKITGLTNHNITRGMQFEYANNHRTSEIKEIVGISDSLGSPLPKTTLKSTIEGDFNKKWEKKK